MAQLRHFGTLMSRCNFDASMTSGKILPARNLRQIKESSKFKVLGFPIKPYDQLMTNFQFFSFEH